MAQKFLYRNLGKSMTESRRWSLKEPHWSFSCATSIPLDLWDSIILGQICVFQTWTDGDSALALSLRLYQAQASLRSSKPFEPSSRHLQPACPGLHPHRRFRKASRVKLLTTSIRAQRRFETSMAQVPVQRDNLTPCGYNPSTLPFGMRSMGATTSTLCALGVSFHVQ